MRQIKGEQRKMNKQKESIKAIGDTALSVAIDFKQLEEHLQKLTEQSISTSAKKAVESFASKVKALDDAWEAIVSIHGFYRLKHGMLDKWYHEETTAVGEPEKAKEHNHCGYRPCPLRVVINGKDILAVGTNKRNANRLFVNTLEIIGEDKIAALNLPRFARNPNVPFITKDRRKLGDIRQIRRTRNGYYVSTNLNNHDKMRMLNRIFKGLGMNASCTIVERQETLF